jgi:tetratricopeptide (TPR) repeat protein
LRILRVLMAAIGLLPVAAGAEAPPPIPPVISFPVAPPAPGKAVDRLTSLVKASGAVQTGGGPVMVEFLTDGADAALRLRRSPQSLPQLFPLTRTADAVRLLADKRMAFLWSPLTEWAGPNLERMRDRQIERLQAAVTIRTSLQQPANTGESTVRPPTRALLQLATFMIDNGRAADAERMLQNRLATMPVQAGQARWEEIEWMSVAALIATSRAARDDVDGALAQFDLIRATLGSSPYAMNATINRAALFANRNRYAEALATIEPLWQQWNAINSTDKVNGSERQFAWIRACALEGLGRHTEADAAFQTVIEAHDSRDRNFVIESDERLKLKGLMCMRRTKSIKQIAAADLRNALFPNELITFQPAYRPLNYAELWAQLRSDPDLAAAARERMRELPPELTPALNGWRTIPRP